MLDLELLEKQLDEVLSQETSETMSSWLFNRRLKKYVSSLGEGEFIDMPSNKLSFSRAVSYNIDTKIQEYTTEITSSSDMLFTAA
ncbi:MAG TPA: hypothetical protein VKZ57_10185 [Sphingobacterium sp.]|nr:hypothetical protein [Sphingobacterium sp.]